ncbi:hypothetical protein M514_05912 [Trichuris suis]|uniref:Uncharacterized protein n=1 Tax=Trichuris suis TaxID=68888 RepID=A0A085MU88_9BILA|nr:hypothetical protein M513_05912 [Trichuris suis]KFD60784.1 hypothetical protein M514_05912 [Trichuris suis]
MAIGVKSFATACKLPLKNVWLEYCTDNGGGQLRARFNRDDRIEQSNWNLEMNSQLDKIALPRLLRFQVDIRVPTLRSCDHTRNVFLETWSLAKRRSVRSRLLVHRKQRTTELP